MAEDSFIEGEVLISHHSGRHTEIDSDEGAGEYQIELQDQQNGTFATPPTSGNSVSTGQSLCYLVTAAVMASLGGVLFGYDVGIISGAILQLREVFCLSCLDQELVVSSMLVGAVLGSLVGGFLIDYFGRRLTIIANAVIFLAGALILGFSPTFSVLVIGRLLVGFAVSVSATGECIYISEIAPAKSRGLLVSLNELGITVGLLLAYLCNYVFIRLSGGWRWMFGLSALPAVVQGVGMVFLPSSPRFLMIKKKEEKAEAVLQKLRGTNRVNKELSTIRVSIASEKNQGCLSLFSSADGMRGRLLVGIGLVFFQQFTGQPNVLYYAPTIFEMVGFHSDSAATLATVGLGIVKVVMTVIALLTVDKFGRRKLLIIGSIVMGISILTLGLSSKFENSGSKPCTDLSECSHGNKGNNSLNMSDIYSMLPQSAVGGLVNQTHSGNSLNDSRSDQNTSSINQTSVKSVTPVIGSEHNTTGEVTPVTVEVPMVRKILGFVALMSYVAAYAFSFGPVTWLVLSEIFPASVKGRAIAMATVFNWGTNLIVTFTFLDLMNALGVTWTFVLFSMICVVSVLFIFSFVPETKNKTLEQVSADMKSKSLFTRLKQNWTGFSCCQPNSSLRIHSNYRRVDSEVIG